MGRNPGAPRSETPDNRQVEEATMQRPGTHASSRKAADVTVRDLKACLDAGEDPRHTIRRLNASIVDCQRDGRDVPAIFIRLTRELTAVCVARGHGVRGLDA